MKLNAAYKSKISHHIEAIHFYSIFELNNSKSLRACTEQNGFRSLFKYFPAYAMLAEIKQGYRMLKKRVEEKYQYYTHDIDGTQTMRRIKLEITRCPCSCRVGLLSLLVLTNRFHNTITFIKRPGIENIGRRIART